MKKTVLGLLIALVTFCTGIYLVKIFLIKYEFVNVPKIEEVKFEKKIESKKVPQQIKIEEENFVSEEKGIYGWYSLERSKLMPEVNMILISGDFVDRNGNPVKKMISFSGVFTRFEDYGDQGFVGDAWTKITGNKVKFKSNKIKGIEYRFNGFFFKNKTSGEEGEKLLRGTLQKYIKGKKVAEISGDFAYYKPYCWH